MFLADELEIGVRVTEMGRSSVMMSYRIERNGELTAEGTTALIVLDYTARKACRLPQPFKQAINTLEGLE